MTVHSLAARAERMGYDGDLVDLYEPPSHLDRCESCGGPADLVAESVSGEPIAVCWDCHEPERGMNR